MINDGPFAWSARLRYDRHRNKVVVRTTGHTVGHVLTAFSGGASRWAEYIAEHPTASVADLESCQAFTRFEIDNPGKNAIDFLKLDDDTAPAPVHPFLKRVADEVPRTYGGRRKVVTVQDATLRILGEAADMFGYSSKGIVNREVVLETLARIAAECQRSAVDLGLVETSDIIDPSFVESDF